jgi:hypothetical protein
MASVSNRPYYRVKILAAIPINTPSYSSPFPIAYVNKGTWLILYPYAYQSTNGAGGNNGISFSTTYLVQGTPGSLTNPGALGTAIGLNSKVNCSNVGGGGGALPVTIYRSITNTVRIEQDETPLFLVVNNTVTGGYSQFASTSPVDANFNWLHFIKLS